MEKITLQGGAELHTLKTDKFKTLTLSLNIYRPIEKEASANALLTAVLKNASAKYPEKIQLEKQLEWMFGAKFSAGVKKKGETQVLVFEISAPVGKYTGENMTKILSEFLFEIVYNPKICENSFDAEIVAREKENLKNRIMALQNDKKEYATQRLTEEMCKGEPYAVYEYGSIAETEKITAETLLEHYRKIISSSKTDIFAIGECDTEEIKKVFGTLSMAGQLPTVTQSTKPDGIKYVEEKMDVTQGKLVIGMKAGGAVRGSKYYDLLVCNSIFGSGTHSKLFNNVREKLSLAYYAYSRLVRVKSLIIVSTGIEFDKYEAARDEIMIQLEEVKKGNITEFEISAAKSSMINAYNSLADTPSTLIDFYINQIVAGEYESIEDITENIRKVTKEGIISAAEEITADTVYFLKGADGDEQ